MISEQDECILGYMTDLKVWPGGLRPGWGTGEDRVAEVRPPRSQEGQGLLDRAFTLLPHFPTRQVEELRFIRQCRKILLFFLKNSYFRNEIIVKEYVVSAAGKRMLPGWAVAGGGRVEFPDSFPSTLSHTRSPAGYGASHSTPFQWHQDFEREAHSQAPQQQPLLLQLVL